MRARRQLADLYRSIGREADARAVEDELLQLLVAADADDPLPVDLHQQ